MAEELKQWATDRVVRVRCMPRASWPGNREQVGELRFLADGKLATFKTDGSTMLYMTTTAHMAEAWLAQMERLHEDVIMHESFSRPRVMALPAPEKAA